MKNKLLSKNNLIVSFVCLIGIIFYVLVVFSFDSIEEIKYHPNYYLITPLFFIGILASGFYSIDYFKKSIGYNLSFGITRKQSFSKYLKTIFLLLTILISFVFVYLCTIIIYLLIKEISFNNAWSFIIQLIEQEMLIDVISYFVFCNALISLLSNYFNIKLLSKELIIIISYVFVISLLFILNIVFGILDGNIIFNLIILVIGIGLIYFNYLITVKKNY